MKKTTYRIVALIIALAMLLPLAACKPKGEDKKKSAVVSADDPYFSVKEVDVYTPKSAYDSVSYYSVPLGDKIGIVMEIYEYNDEMIDYDKDGIIEPSVIIEPDPVDEEIIDEEIIDEDVTEEGDEITDETIDPEELDPDYYEEDPYYYQQSIKRLLYVYDLDGNRVGETDMAFLTGDGGDAYIQSIQGDGQGNIAILMQSYDPETWESTTELIVVDTSGKEIKPRVEFSGGENSWFSSIAFDAQGNMYSCSYMETGVSITIKDPQGKDLATVKEQQNSGGTLYTIDGNVYMDVYSDTGYDYKIYRIDPQTGELVEPIDMTYLSGQVTYGSDGMYITKAGGISSYDIKTKEQVEVLSWNDTDLDMSKYYYSSWVPMTKDKFINVSQNYNYDYMRSEEQVPEPVKLVILTREKTNPNAGKTILVLGGFGLSYRTELSAEIYNYNKTSTKYRIETKDYSDLIDYSEITGEDYDYMKIYAKAVEQLYMDMINGDGPDILMSGDGLTSLDRFESKGLLTDLYKLAEKDETFKKEDYIQSVISLFERDGKLYQFPTSFYMQGLVGPTRFVGDRTGWTVDEFGEMVNNLPEGVYTLVNVQQSDLLVQSLMLSMGSFVDYAKNEVRFDSPEFYKLLEFAKTYGSDVVENPKPFDAGYIEDGYIDEWELMNQGKLALRMAYLYSPSAIAETRYEFGEPVTFVGYPSSNKAGMSCSASQTYAISSESPNQEAAWEFISYFIGKEAQMAMPEYSEAPIRVDALDAKIEKLLAPREENDYYWYGEQMTREDADQFLAMVESISTIAGADGEILSIVQEETPAYFKGLKSAEDVAKIIQDRVKTLVNERA
ncbi:MAG: extracellular solute-binding protein [Clostridiales bacterium]|nr:extracellular solute-binding protein [Clostridiales bacterium]